MGIIDPQDIVSRETVKGVQYKILVKGENVMVVLFELEPHASVPLHDHVEEQAGIVLKGDGDFEIGENVYRVREGMAYHVPSGVSHRVEVGEDGGIFLDIFSPPRKDL
ncbi:MAG: cupin domain-containing protein [Asgard group archaeon]